jgi:hypothetical protein
MSRWQVVPVVAAALAVIALLGCLGGSKPLFPAHAGRSKVSSLQILASSQSRCCQERPTDAPNPPEPNHADAVTAQRISKTMGLGSTGVAAIMKTQSLKSATPGPLKFSKALYSVDFIQGMEWTPHSTRDSSEATTIAKVQNGVKTPSSLAHAAATKHFEFGTSGKGCKGTALVFIQWDNSNIADFIFRATVLDAFFSQFDKTAKLKPGSLSAKIDTVIIWAGLISWSREFLKLIVPHSEVVTRKQLEDSQSDRCWSNGFFFTDNTPQLTLWAKPMQNFRKAILMGLNAQHATVSRKPKTAMIINKGSGIRQVLNRKEVAELLEKHGIKTDIQEWFGPTTKLTFKQQVTLMNRHDWVISAHGAELANLVFMRPGSAVTELFPWMGEAEWFNDRYLFYRRLSVQLGLRYWFYRDFKERKPTKPQRPGYACDTDIHVDVGAFAKIITDVSNVGCAGQCIYNCNIKSSDWHCDQSHGCNGGYSVDTMPHKLGYCSLMPKPMSVFWPTGLPPPVPFAGQY